jgi:hypothetical protein
MPDRIQSEYTSDRMPGMMLGKKSDKVSEKMSEFVSDRMPDKMLNRMSDREY